MTVTVAKNRCQGRAASDGGMFGDTSVRELLDLPEAQPVIARLARQVSEFSTIDTTEHVLLVAAFTLRCRRHPLTKTARPTL